MNEYRFDDAYEKVYRLAEDESCYSLYCTYRVCGITSGMCDSEKLRRVDREDAMYDEVAR